MTKREMREGSIYLIDALLQNSLLILDTKSPRIYHIPLQHTQHNRIIHRARHGHPITPRVQLRPHRLDVLPARRQDLRVILQHRQRLARRRRHHGGQRSREGVCSGADPLVFNDVYGTGTEAAAGAEGAAEGAHDHVNGRGVDILGFGEAAPGAPEDAKGTSLVEDEAEFVAEAELDLVLLVSGSNRRLKGKLGKA